MYRISKQYTFSAAHQLDYLPDDHPCNRLHGHNYTVEVILASEVLNADSFVLDFNKLDEAMNPIIALLDHHDLNHTLAYRTTSEMIAWWIYSRVSKDLGDQFAVVVEKVRVSETPKTWAEYTP